MGCDIREALTEAVNHDAKGYGQWTRSMRDRIAALAASDGKR